MKREGQKRKRGQRQKQGEEMKVLAAACTQGVLTQLGKPGHGGGLPSYAVAAVVVAVVVGVVVAVVVDVVLVVCVRDRRTCGQTHLLGTTTVPGVRHVA